MSPTDNPTIEGKNTLNHIAIIMDGNGRWAKKRFLPRFAGHKAGLTTVKNIVKYCVEKKFGYLTLFAFSSENWRRPKKEVGLLMELFATALDSEIKKLYRSNVRLNVIGDLSQFSDKLQNKIQSAVDETAQNTGLVLTIAANYGGRWDITQAVKKISKQVQNNTLRIDSIDESVIESFMVTRDLPEPDLFIRTGGEQRISNFILWHLAYSEFFFTDVLWPDFDAKVFSQAISSYNSRQRRFGRTGEQVDSK